jgi:hypothetical protein
MEASASTKRRVRILGLCLIGGGILTFVIGVLMGGMEGAEPWRYFGPAGLILVAMGIVLFIGALTLIAG